MFKNMGGNIPGGNFLDWNFPGGTLQGEFDGWEFSGGEFSRGNLMGGNFPGGSFPGGIFLIPLKWPYIPDHPYRILITGCSGSEKSNELLNLINNQSDIHKIHLYAKDPFE